MLAYREDCLLFYSWGVAPQANKLVCELAYAAYVCLEIFQEDIKGMAQIVEVLSVLFL